MPTRRRRRFELTRLRPRGYPPRLAIRAEDVASVGTANFESSLRQNLQLRLADELDRQALTGDGTNDDLEGFFHKLAAITDATAVIDFDGFVCLDCRSG